MVTFRPMTFDELGLVEGWLRAEHVARWWLEGTTAEQEIADCRASIAGEQPTTVLLVLSAGAPIGWCQWYRCSDYPDFAADVEAGAADVGIDYAIGVQGLVDRGLGTRMVADLVELIRARHPAAGIVADPAEANVASRRVLEKCGFQLLGVRPLASEPTDGPMAIYRLLPAVAQDPSGKVG